MPTQQELERSSVTAVDGREGGDGLAPSIVWGALVFVVILLAGAAFVVTRPNQWSATATAVVVPDPNLDPIATAGYYETLSRGQIVATAAEILQLRRFGATAADRLGLSPQQQDTVTVKTLVVPDTAIIQVVATGPDAGIAERMADTVLAEVNTSGILQSPYVLSPLSGAAGTARRSGPSVPIFAGVVLLVSVIAAVSTQQAAYHLSLAVRSGRRTPPAQVVPAPPPADLGAVHWPVTQAVTTAGPTVGPGAGDLAPSAAIIYPLQDRGPLPADARHNGRAIRHNDNTANRTVGRAVPQTYIGSTSAAAVEAIAQHSRREPEPGSQ